MKKLIMKWSVAFVAAAAMVALGSCGGSKQAESEENAGEAVEQAAVEPGEVLDVTEDEYAAKVADFTVDPMVYVGSKPAIVDFWATWCGPCVALSPVLHKVAEETGVTVYKVNVDDCPKIAEAYGVNVIPYLLLCKDGKVEVYAGDRSDADLLDTARSMME